MTTKIQIDPNTVWAFATRWLPATARHRCHHKKIREFGMLVERCRCTLLLSSSIDTAVLVEASIPAHMVLAVAIVAAGPLSGVSHG